MIEKWLANNCVGTWEVRLEDLSEDMTMKAYMILFADPDDATAFKIAVRLPGMPARDDLDRRAKGRPVMPHHQ
jgi:hypothetical protein